MPCGCGGKSNGRNRGGAQARRQTALTPEQRRKQAAAPPRAQRNLSAIEAEKRRTQALRRQAIKRALGK